MKVIRLVKGALQCIAQDARGQWRIANGSALFLFGFPFVALAAGGLLRTLDKSAWRRLLDEDGPVEWVQFGLLVVACLFCAAAARELLRRRRGTLAMLYVAATLGLFFVAGEEVAWGQRIIGFSTPAALAGANYKAEVSVHNMSSMVTAFNGAKLLIGLYGALGCWALIAFGRYRWSHGIGLPIVPTFLSSAFFIVFLQRALRFTILRDSVPVGYGEVEEVVLAYGLAAFAMLTWRRERLAMGAPDAERSASAKIASDEPPPPDIRLAYVVSRFPKLTETFVLSEIVTLRAKGHSVDVYPLIRERHDVVHRQAAEVDREAHHSPYLSWHLVRAQCHYLLGQPRTYIGLIVTMVRAMWRHPDFLGKALVLFPKSVGFAYDMRLGRVNHVHAHFATFPAITAWIVHALTGIPYSFTAHGSDLHVDKRRSMLAETMASAAFVRTVSHYNCAFIKRIYGEEAGRKVRVVHCGIETERFLPPSQAPFDGTLKILCVASFDEVKGHRHLIGACRSLKARGVAFECHLVGDGPLRRELTAEIERLELSSSMTLHGSVPTEVVQQLLHRSDVTVLPSVISRRGDREGIPVALMEAMATGLPVVSTRLSGIPELVEDQVCGLLVEPGDSLGLADAIERLAADPALRRRLGAAARSKVSGEFDVNETSESLASLFAQSLARPTRRSERTIPGRTGGSPRTEAAAAHLMPPARTIG